MESYISCKRRLTSAFVVLMGSGSVQYKAYFPQTPYLVNQERSAATVVDEQVAADLPGTILHKHSVAQIFSKSLSLPSKDSGSPGFGYGSCNANLSAEDICRKSSGP